MPRLHFHKKPCRQSHIKQFSQHGGRHGHPVAVTASTWQLQGHCGNIGVCIPSLEDTGTFSEVKNFAL